MIPVIGVAIMGYSLYWVGYFPIWYVNRLKRDLKKK